MLLHLISELVGEMQLRNYNHFMGDYTKQLLDIEDALGCEKAKLWEKRLSPVVLQVKTYLCFPSLYKPNYTCPDDDRKFLPVATVL